MPYKRVQLADNVIMFCGDCAEVLQDLDADSIDSCVTDPPYGLSSYRVGAMCACAEEGDPDPKCKVCGGTGKVLPKGKGGFMGCEWDLDIPEVKIWKMANDILKPGAHILAFAGTRTQHRMACNIEDGGFEIRDMMAWMYGSGVPKGLDVSRAIDKHLGTQSKVIDVEEDRVVLEAGSEEAGRFDGWWTNLKPAMEPITVARKIITGTVVENVLKHGTGAMNIKGCKIEDDSKVNVSSLLEGVAGEQEESGRWPTNILHDGSDEAVSIFPGKGKKSSARFFWCAKASTLDRDEGLYGFTKKECGVLNKGAKKRNFHPTCKPTDLMRYLCKLVTRPGGIVLDPFMGSGSTGKGAILEGMGFIGIERDEESFEIAVARVRHALMVMGRETIELTPDMVTLKEE